MKSKLRSWKDRFTWFEKAVWAIFYLSLPVTSFPFLPPALGGVALVRPLAIYPLLILLVIATLPRFIGKPLPKSFVPLLVFALALVAGSVFAFLRGMDDLLGVSQLDRGIRSFLTLGLGAAFYLTVALLPRNRSELHYSLKWLYIGFTVALLWASLQAVYVIYYSPEYFQWLNDLQSFISTRRLFPNRVSGLTYEPNWFAEQIGLLLMPWLFASVLSRRTVFRWRWRWVTLELLLLVWSMIVLIFTYSRAGLGVAGALSVLSVFMYRSDKPAREPRRRLPFSRLAQRAATAALVIIILAGVVFWIGSQNGYFSRLWRYWTEEESTGEYLEFIAFSQRFIYWEAGYRMFERYPVLGVGLGNFAFYFEDMLPDRSLVKTPEILRLITPEPGRARLVTSKNLYTRLLAETGLVGTAAFIAFLFSILGWVFYLWTSPQQEHRFWGNAGVLGFAAFALAALSFDSFALPNMWVIFGLLTASAQVYSSTGLSEALTPDPEMGMTTPQPQESG
jgi:hypothetical protein